MAKPSCSASGNQEIGYVSDRLGLTLTAQRELLHKFFRPDEPTDHPRSLRGALRYRLSSTCRHDIDPDLLAAGSIQERDDLVTSVMPSLALELRDLPSDPRRGSFHYAAFEVGSTALGGDRQLRQVPARRLLFFPWPPPTVLAVPLAWASPRRTATPPRS